MTKDLICDCGCQYEKDEEEYCQLCSEIGCSNCVKQALIPIINNRFDACEECWKRIRLLNKAVSDQEKYNHLIEALTLIYPETEGQIKTTILHHLLAAGVEVKE